MATSQEIVDRFPAFATLLQIPDVANLVQLASAPGQNWSPAFFQEQLWNTAWWKGTSETSRTWEARKLVDPETAGQQSAQMASKVVGIASSLGLHLSPAEVAFYSEVGNQRGWDDQALTRQLIDSNASQKYAAGSMRATQDSLKGTAASYGVPVSEGLTMDWARKIESGRMTTQGFEDFMRTAAKMYYPTIQKEIDSGFTVRQVADPYLQTASNLLGRPADQMSLLDPKWQRAFQSRDAKGGFQGPMAMLDWQRTLMTDAAYGYDQTENGKVAALQMRDSLGKSFGLVA